jgi:beta-N-acetylhexosaminidase
MRPNELARVLLSAALVGCIPSRSALTPASSGADAAWVERTLASLSLREKAGQMIMPWVGGEYTSIDSPEFDRIAQWVEREGAGGFVVSIGLPHSYAAKLNALQQRARVPLLIASDMENGPGMRLNGIYALPYLLPQGGGTSFPPAMAFGAAGSDSLTYEMGRVLAREARAVGVHVTFGPVVDVNSNPANPIINTRSFGEDPAQVARLAAAYVRGTHEGGLLTTAKHFPGHGDTETDSHLDLPTIRADQARLDSVELVPYRALVRQGVDGVMSAHIAVTGVEGSDAPPATLSAHFLTRVLRDDLGFRGLVYTDAMNMGAVVRHYGAEEALVRSVLAGADVLLMPLDVHQAVETLVGAVQSGRITESRIDASVRRILATKARAGLASSRFVDLESVDRVVGRRAHTQLAQRVAERSITLARDSGQLVPLAAEARRVLVLTYAAQSDLVSGSAFVAALGAQGGARRVASARIDARATPEELRAVRAQADSADVVIAAMFVSPIEGSGTISAGSSFAGLVQELAASRRRVIAVSFGTPYLLSSFPAVGSYLLAWGGADVCQMAAASALLGESPITGKLPVSIPPYHRRGEGLTRVVARP